jgi:polyvinyl alcohol dehydrogenase (cytochrome)
VVWSRDLDAHPFTRLYSSPVVAGDVLVIGVASYELTRNVPDFTFQGSVVGLDPDTGAELWRLPTTTDSAGASVWSSAAIDEQRGLAYIGVGQSYEEPASPLTDALLAIDYETGELVWSRQFTADDVFTFFPNFGPGPDWDIGASPNLFRAGGRDLVGVGDKRGVYAALDRETGETVWARELTRGGQLGGVMATAAYAHGVVYVTSNVMPGPTGDVTNGTSVTFALDARTGEVRWQRPLPKPTFGALTVANRVLFQPTTAGTLYALDTRSGDVLWATEPGGLLGGGVSVSNGRVLTGHGFSFLTAPPDPVGGLVAYELPDD